MTKDLSALLEHARGRSEFVIIVVADIRGFSAFSTANESPNIAMFIKRFYLQMLNHYFAKASFAKTTGDGLLMTFPYSDTPGSLQEQSNYVVTSIIRCLQDFPKICDNDPMINFQVPNSIGFGVSRGTACCLFSGDEVIDYSGHLLNLASRLMDLARPSGVVIDSNFQKGVIPKAYQDAFDETEVYVRSIAEEAPIRVFFHKELVKIPELNRTKLRGEVWYSETRTILIRELKKMSDLFGVALKKPAKDASKVKVKLGYPRKDTKGYTRITDYLHFTVTDDPLLPMVVVNLKKAKELVLPLNLVGKAEITFTVQYVPKLV